MWCTVQHNIFFQSFHWIKQSSNLLCFILWTASIASDRCSLDMYFVAFKWFLCIYATEGKELEPIGISCSVYWTLMTYEFTVMCETLVQSDLKLLLISKICSSLVSNFTINLSNMIAQPRPLTVNSKTIFNIKTSSFNIFTGIVINLPSKTILGTANSFI